VPSDEQPTAKQTFGDAEVATTLQRHRALDAPVLSVTFLNTDATRLRFGPASLDAVVSVLIHVPHGDAVVRGERSHQTGQEWRSTGHGAAHSVTVMCITIYHQGRQGMEAHVSSILLGVQDMDRSKRFYTEGLGWKVQRDYGVSVFFEPHGGSLVGFYGRDGLAADVGTSPEGSGFSGMVFTHVVRSEARVDEIIAEAETAGATILKPAATLQWGGYGGSFADPDGYIWNIGYSARGKDQPYAE
jgi:uncharacterized protein